MSSQDPTRETTSAVAPNGDTMITIGTNNSTQNNTTTSGNQTAAGSVIESEDLNSSIGSQRSLNNRLFPFRFNRDTILNNVSFKTLAKHFVR